MTGYSLRYSILSSRLDQLWFPFAFWLLFAFTAGMMRGANRNTVAAQAYLGCVLPLVSGVLASYAVLEDPALELRFASPATATRMLMERMGFIVALQAVCAVAFQLWTATIGPGFSVPGGWPQLQLAWLVPSLALLAAGCAVSLIAKKSSVGALAAGLIWLVQIILRGWMASSDWARYLLIFMSPLMPEHPFRTANQLSLLAMTAVLLAGSAALLRRQERYL